MTRDRIIQLLDLVVLELANNVPPPENIAPTVQQVIQGQRGVSDAEWAYVKGLASNAVLQLRDRLASLRP